MTLRGLKEYAQAEEVLAGFGVDLESVSDLSCEIGMSETAEYWEKVQRTSARPHIDLIPGGYGTGTRLMRADTRQRGTWPGVQFSLISVALPSLSLDLRLTILIDHE
jgi:hypothetical protein